MDESEVARLQPGDYVNGSEYSDFGFTPETVLRVMEVEGSPNPAGARVEYTSGPCTSNPEGPTKYPKQREGDGWMLVCSEIGEKIDPPFVRENAADAVARGAPPKPGDKLEVVGEGYGWAEREIGLVVTVGQYDPTGYDGDPGIVPVENVGNKELRMYNNFSGIRDMVIVERAESSASDDAVEIFEDLSTMRDEMQKLVDSELEAGPWVLEDWIERLRRVTG